MRVGCGGEELRKIEEEGGEGKREERTEGKRMDGERKLKGTRGGGKGGRGNERIGKGGRRQGNWRRI